MDWKAAAGPEPRGTRISTITPTSLLFLSLTVGLLAGPPLA